MSPDDADAAWAAAEYDRSEQARAAQEVAAEIAATALAAEHHANARRVHIRPEPGDRLDNPTGPDPRGRHVPCDCAARVGVGCQHPSRRTPVGFVHPSRLEAERVWWASRG